MAVFGINCGHTKSGYGSGAVGIISESEHTRKVGYELMRLIRESGHKAVDCTIDYAKNTNESLSKIIEVANNVELDWFISIHFNAGGGKGTEVYTYKGRQYTDAVEVCQSIASLGFKNRGVKEGTGLYVIRKTKAKSMLIEVCFVDTEDANTYLVLGYAAIAKAIAKALINYVEKEDVINMNALPLDFSEKFYLMNYPDVASAVKRGDYKEGKDHYLVYGKKEGRAYKPQLPSDFTEVGYLINNQDVADAVNRGDYRSGSEHWYKCGFAEQRSYKLEQSNKSIDLDKLKNDLINTIQEKFNNIK